MIYIFNFKRNDPFGAYVTKKATLNNTKSKAFNKQSNLNICWWKICSWNNYQGLDLSNLKEMYRIARKNEKIFIKEIKETLKKDMKFNKLTD